MRYTKSLDDNKFQIPAQVISFAISRWTSFSSSFFYKITAQDLNTIITSLRFLWLSTHFYRSAGL